MNFDTALFEKSLGFVVLAGLVVACAQILAPFLGSIAWATIMAVATWPMFVRLRHRLGGRRRLAATVMTVVLAVAFVVPVVLVTVSLKDGVHSLSAAATDLTSFQIPEPPARLTTLPLVGPRIERAWRDVQADRTGIVEALRPRIGAAALWLLAQGARLVRVMIEFILAVALVGVLYGTGDGLARLVERAAERIGGERGRSLVALSAVTIRSVSAGVIGTAVLQALLSAITFAIAGVPGVAILGVFSFIFATLQVGTGPVWIPVAVWLVLQDRQGAAAFILVSGIVINLVDNLLKPLLIGRKEGGPPAMLLFVGVLGGLLTWGLIGVFLGATLVAISYTLTRAWLDEQPALSS